MNARPIEDRLRAALDELASEVSRSRADHPSFILDPPRWDPADRRAHPAGRRSRLHEQGAWRRRRLSLAVALAGAAAIVGSALFLTQGSAPPAYAAPVLERAAQVAAAQPGGWPDGRYWYTMYSHTLSDDSGRLLRPVDTFQAWIGHDGSRLLRGPGLPGPPAVTPSAVPPPLSAHGQLSTDGLGPSHTGIAGMGATVLSWDQLYQLPPDPAGLGVWLRGHLVPDSVPAGSPDGELFDLIVRLLTQTPASPALRSALYQVVTTIPGVQLDGSAVDSQGRHGVAMEHSLYGPGSKARLKILVDPADAALLQTQMTTLQPPNGGRPQQLVTETTTYLAAGIATEPGVVPLVHGTA